MKLLEFIWARQSQLMVGKPCELRILWTYKTGHCFFCIRKYLPQRSADLTAVHFAPNLFAIIKFQFLHIPLFSTWMISIIGTTWLYNITDYHPQLS